MYVIYTMFHTNIQWTRKNPITAAYVLPYGIYIYELSQTTHPLSHTTKSEASSKVMSYHQQSDQITTPFSQFHNVHICQIQDIS